MFNRIAFAAIVLAFVSTATVAQPQINLINSAPGGVTGSTHVMANAVAEKLDSFKVNYRLFEANCAAAKAFWDASREPTMYIMLTNSGTSPTDRENAACFIEATRENFVAPLWYAGSHFCATVGGKKTWEDFIRPGSRHVVSIDVGKSWEDAAREMGRQFKTDLRLVPVQSSAQNRAMALAGETDFSLRLSLNAQPEFKCIATTDELVQRYEWMKPFSKGLGTYAFIVAKNMTPEQIAYTRQKIREATLSETLVKLREQRGHTLDNASWSTPAELNARIEEFFKTYY